MAMSTWNARVSELKQDIRALGFALTHPRTPWYTKALAVWVVAYAISPLDLIPDPIPLLGYLDDAVLLPLGVWLIAKMIPMEVLEECRRRAETESPYHPWLRWSGGAAILFLWGALLWWMVCYVWRW
jgi:uncharacterized membrane protein YkvA (DUF1232 family)